MDDPGAYDPWADDEDMASIIALDDWIENGVGGFRLLDKLAEAGAPTPPADELGDAEMARALTDLVWGLYDQGVIVYWTDHLSDRELYTELRAFCEEDKITFPHDPYSNLRWSPIGACDEEDIVIHHRFYADDQERDDWARQFPEDEMPPKELPPYPRPWIPNEVPRTPRRERIEP